MAALAQTITIIKDRKVVNTSKQLVGVFKEAKAAYFEKKAELKASRQNELITRSSTFDQASNRIGNSQPSPTSGQRSSAAPALLNPHPQQFYQQRDAYSPAPSPSNFRSHLERGYTDSFYANDEPLANQSSWSIGGNPDYYAPTYGQHELSRRYSVADLRHQAQQSYYGTMPENLHRSASFDEDLAYGELPPPLPPRHMNEGDELQLKMSSVNRILEEANCMQHSAKAIMNHLQSKPEAMAAVALTLAEISNLLTKMRPGTLWAFRGTFPAVIALLLSPEFLIAAGVGVGLTVVAFGGYKIVKRIKAKRAGAAAAEPEELENVTAEIEGINTWRRGVSEYDARSIGMSADEEFITPMASMQLRDMARQHGRGAAVAEYAGERRRM